MATFSFNRTALIKCHTDEAIMPHKVQLLQELQPIDHPWVFASLSGHAIDSQKMPILAKIKIIFSDEAHSDLGGYVNKQNCCSLGHRKPARIHWKANAPKTNHCLVRILVQGHNWGIFLRKCVTVRYSQWWSLLGHVEWIFVHINWRATFGFNRTALRATQPKLNSMFCALFLKIALSAAEQISFGHLGAAICHRWTIICGLPSKISFTPTSQRQLTL